MQDGIREVEKQQGRTCVNRAWIAAEEINELKVEKGARASLIGGWGSCACRN